MKYYNFLDVSQWTEGKVSVRYSARAVLSSLWKFHRRWATIACSNNSLCVYTLDHRGSTTIKCVNDRWILAAGEASTIISHIHVVLPSPNHLQIIQTFLKFGLETRHVCHLSPTKGQCEVIRVSLCDSDFQCKSAHAYIITKPVAIFKMSTTHPREIALGPEVSHETSAISLDTQKVMRSHSCLTAQLWLSTHARACA